MSELQTQDTSFPSPRLGPKALLASNALYERREQDRQYEQGEGASRAGEVIGREIYEYEKTREEQERREEAAEELLRRLRVVGAQVAPTQSGHAGVFVRVENRASEPTPSVNLRILYLDARGRVVAEDRSCVIQQGLAPRSVVQVGCYLREVQGAVDVSVEVAGF